MSWVVGGSVAITALVVFWLSLSGFFTQRAWGALSSQPNPLRIRITGQQFSWNWFPRTSFTVFGFRN
jgi:heme/copper-type cytochrome/quinol oxidase subunit 2